MNSEASVKLSASKVNLFMADLIFENERLVHIYDVFDGERSDLAHYVNLVKELRAKSILDVGCGTGSLALLLAQDQLQVVALDPAAASVKFAQTKPQSEKVTWLVGEVTGLAASASFDLALMTGNVAQVFVSDSDFEKTLIGVNQQLKSGGYFVFEVRDPLKTAWTGWTREKTFKRLYVSAEIGWVQTWCELLEVKDDVVTFEWSYLFESTNEAIRSKSTLRFRSREQVTELLVRSGFTIQDVRDAPDRPGLELVFIAKKANPKVS